MSNQAYLFLIFVVNGILIGILFDIFRILRKTFKTTDFITYIEDIIFWILTGILTLYFIFYYNNGEIRLYIFAGILLGTLIYMLTISKYFIQYSVSIITYVKTIVLYIFKIILYPFNIVIKILKKILFRPISFIFVNISTIFTKSKLNITNVLKKHHKIVKKET